MLVWNAPYTTGVPGLIIWVRMIPARAPALRAVGEAREDLLPDPEGDRAHIVGDRPGKRAKEQPLPDEQQADEAPEEEKEPSAKRHRAGNLARVVPSSRPHARRPPFPTTR